MKKNLLRRICLMVLASFFILPVISVFSADKTLDNLQTAYNSEVNANTNYLAFAAKAKEEGYMDVYRLFMAVAKSAEIHAKYHAKIISDIGSTPVVNLEPIEVKTTKENLEVVLKGETYEKDNMYPDFVKQAELDKQDGAINVFRGIMAAEADHVKHYTDAVNNLEDWKDSGKKFMVCGKCGYMTMDFSIKICPICSYPREQFIEFK